MGGLRCGAGVRLAEGGAGGMRRRVSRREVCRGGIAAAATFAVVPRDVLGGGEVKAPGEKLNLAVIGTGSHGMRHLQALLANQPDVRIVAVCDVNRESRDYYDLKGSVAGREPARRMVEAHYGAQKRSGKYRGCAVYRDFRELLKRQKDIDAVLIATPDHSHAVIAMAAIQSGKHVYCEKPLTHTIEEARRLAQAARAAKVVTQMGNQLHALETVRRQVEVVRAGLIGRVREVHAWCGDTGWQGPWSPVRQRRWAADGAGWSRGPDRPRQTPPVPQGLDWDLWLGPAPFRPCHPAYLPFKWRGWWAFGSGTLGDMGCHILDPVFWALGLKHAKSVEACSVLSTSETAPVAAVVHYEFPARGELPPVRLTWYDGGLKPPRPAELPAERELPSFGVLYVGEDGKLLVPYGGEPLLLPESRRREIEQVPRSLPRVQLQIAGPNPISLAHQHREWIDACQGRAATQSHFDYAGPLTEAVLLGVVAIRTGRKLDWDWQALQVTNLPDADQYIRSHYRDGWTL